MTLDYLNKLRTAYSNAFKDYTLTNFGSAITMPPPNVTGNLHIGHAFNLFLQDLFVRFYKLRGTNIKWIPGTDHAGIATQLLVKNKLIQEGSDNFTNEDLLQEIWTWKSHYEKNIKEQIAKMGTLLNWDSYKFTLDQDIQAAVTRAFCVLYNNGIIFKQQRIVNWDTSLKTVISDIEAVNKEVDGYLWHINYSTEDGDILTIATTRPETMFADEAIAVHPNDERYSHLHGKLVRVPLINKLIPIIPDEACSIDKGTGAVKIDPAHSILDFEIAKKHNLPIVKVINEHGLMCGPAPEWLQGLDRFEARKLVVAKLEQSNYIVKVESIKHLVPHGARSGTVLEPIATDQWFFDMPKLAPRAKDIIQNNEILLVPERFKDIYMHYIDNIQSWCISRQIIWGHQIPAWYDDEGNVYVAENHEEAQAQAPGKELKRDRDVLDTWFSSALWPMLVLGWPNTINPKLYPNPFLVTGSDILFFWVTKMIMMHIGIFGNTGIPFKVVYLHGLVQDEYGLKMSKSKGNVVEPLELLQEHGRDIVTFAMLYAAPSGYNLKFGKQNIDKAQKFLNKIWNGLNLAVKYIKRDPVRITHPANTWIITKSDGFEKSIADKLLNWQVYEAVDEIYHFFWDYFCGWYLESVKSIANQTEYSAETRYALYHTCRRILKVMHPFLPEITEYFWQEITGQKNILDTYSELNINIETVDRQDDFDFARNLILQLRSIKTNFDLSDAAEIYIAPELNSTTADLVQNLLKHPIVFKDHSANTDYIQFGCSGTIVWLKKVDCNVENFETRFENIIAKIKSDLDLLDAKLNDPGFMQHANPDEVKKKVSRKSELLKDIDIYQEALSGFSN